MRFLRLTCLGILVLLSLTPAWVSAVEPPVAALVQENLRTQNRSDFFVVLREDTALEVLDEADHLSQICARRQFIVDELKSRAIRSQHDLATWLKDRGVDYQQFWIVNQILVRQGTPELLREILARNYVLRIDANPQVRVALPEPQAAPPRTAAPAAVEWGIANIKADQVWSRYGVRGAGIVVAVQDTGVMWTHEALKNPYRGWNGSVADHTFSWHDAIHATSHGSPCGSNAPAPCDDVGHGTHVTGTIAGYTAANQIGVAPGAKWIACRNMDRGYGTPATYMECFQWFLAPGGKSSQAPHIISNSWGCPPSEGCNQDTLEATIQVVVNAGIMVVMSNGNAGPNCASTQDPPAIYPQSFSVGAIDSAESLATFSSRGPVTYKAKTYIKPDISAPGVGVRSSSFSGGYTTMSGTSMAAPHVSGVVALLWSGLPGLMGRIDLTRQILSDTSRPKSYTFCGNPEGVPNNGFGWGIVDALAALQRGTALTGSPHLPLLLD